MTAVIAPPPVALAANVERDGWVIDYALSASDGLRVSAASFAERTMLAGVSLVEWHADSGSQGFVLSTGTGGSGGGFPIAPFGDTAVLDLLGTGGAPEGFELVQDFRMASWGAPCNYRFEQRLQFFADGRFRVLSGAYGRGCSEQEIYRPVVRIDVALDGDEGDSLSRWSGSAWLPEPMEGVWTQVGQPLLGAAAWRVDDVGGAGLGVEPGADDEAWLYATRHRPEEGDADLSVVGTCCNDDAQQGPDAYLDGESIANANLVLWYVPQLRVDASLADGDGYACWTIQGEPTPNTHPCFAGPTLVPIPAPEAAGGAAAVAALALVAVRLGGRRSGGAGGRRSSGNVRRCDRSGRIRHRVDRVFP